VAGRLYLYHPEVELELTTMSYEETWRGKPISDLNSFEADIAWQDDLTLDQELAIVDESPFEY
jgi:hypothetical protein